MTPPSLPGLFAEISRLAGETLDRRPFGSGHAVEPCGRDYQQALVTGDVIAAERRVLRVVEAHHQRPDAGLHDRAHAFEPGRQVPKHIAATHRCLGLAVDPQDRPDHDTKGTLRADEQLMQRWAGGGSGTWPRRRKRAVG